MSHSASNAPIGVLLSGGLDSCILLGHLLERGQRVRPFYVHSQLLWQAEELRAAKDFLRAVASPRLQELVILELPLTDLYGDHWSITGDGVPDGSTADDAVYLPGRNPLLLIKAALWCRLHGIGRLALAVLSSNPFADASPDFFRDFESALACATGDVVEILRPFEDLDKRRVMQLGRRLPLGLTFSCISPVAGLHCGVCNKCAERNVAFGLLGVIDPTRYACDSRASATRPQAAKGVPY